MTEVSFFDQVGGESFFRALVDDFYKGVATDEVLRPMYPDEHLGAANDRLRLFLIQYWGGPHTYSELRGHPRLRMRHAEFTIDETARDHWLEHMMKAVELRELPEPLKEELVTYLVQVAHFLLNTYPEDISEVHAKSDGTHLA
jgi:hemoglobin